MSVQEYVRDDFEEFIRLDPSVPKELRDSLRLKERTPKFLDNLTDEIIKCELAGIKLDRMKIKQMVYSLAAFFVRALKTQAEEMAMSDLARSARKAELEGDPVANKLDDHGNGDLTEELGIKIVDKGG